MKINEASGRQPESGVVHAADCQRELRIFEVKMLMLVPLIVQMKKIQAWDGHSWLVITGSRLRVV